MNDERKDGSQDNGNGAKGVLPLLVILFLPCIIIGGIYYSLIRFWRLKPNFIFLIALIVDVLAVVYGCFSDALTKIVMFFNNITDISFLQDNWVMIIPAVVVFGFIGGSIIGFILVLMVVAQMRNNPHRLMHEGDWMYQFKFRKTPWEKYRKRKKISMLQNGSFADDERAPLGLDEKHDDSVVYRYKSEAVKPTILSGSAGSGKAIHKNTIIPTPYGFKTVNDLHTGDMILDDLGKPTKIIGKYQPMTKDHYQITFDNGITIKSCGDHLWKDYYTNNIINTRQIYHNFMKKIENSIGIVKNPVSFDEKIFNDDLYDIGVRALSGDYDNSIIEKISFSSIQQRYIFLNGYLSTVNQKISNDCPYLIFYSDDKIFLQHLNNIFSSLAYKTCLLLNIHDNDLGSSDSGAQNILKVFITERFYGDQYPYLVFDSFDSFVFSDENVVVEEISIIDDFAEDYYCFEVDSLSHLFLCSGSYLVTHNTITMLSLMLNDIMTGTPVMVVDFKRSPELSAKLAAWCKEYGREFYHFVNGDPETYNIPGSSGQSFYDPLKNGRDAKADMILGIREYDIAATVWKDAMRNLLQVLFPMLRYADRKKAPNIDWDHGEIYKIASAISGGNFTELAAACEGTVIEQQAIEMDRDVQIRSHNAHRAMSELQGQMRTMIASPYGRWLKTSKNSRNIDLYELTNKPGNVVLFSLNSDSEKDFSKYFGSLILSDLNAVSAKRRNEGATNLLNVYIDEFQAVNPTSLTPLLEKARESKIGMTISSQSFEQIVSASEGGNGEAVLESILDNCSNFIAHSGATEKSANRLAGILGKDFKTVYKQNNKNESRLFSRNYSNRRNQNLQTSLEEQWIVPPRDFMKAEAPTKSNGYRSTAMIVNKSSEDPLFQNEPGAVARLVWMIPNQQVLQTYYHGGMEDTTSENISSLQEALAKQEENDNKNLNNISLKKGNEFVHDDVYQYVDLSDDDEEEDDGNFSWETIDDSSDEIQSYNGKDYDKDLADLADIPIFDEKDKVSDKKQINNSSYDSGINDFAKKVSRRSTFDDSAFSKIAKNNERPKSLKDYQDNVVVDDDEALPDLDDLF